MEQVWGSYTLPSNFPTKNGTLQGTEIQDSWELHDERDSNYGSDDMWD